MVQDTGAEEVARLTFEDALAELETIVRRLEEGSGRLDDAIAAYERGSHLRRHCETKLHQAQLRVERVMINAQGSAFSQPVKLD